MRVLRKASLLALCVSLVACAPSARNVFDNGGVLTGTIAGGQQPVSGVTVQLFTVGTGGDGTAATPLTTPVTTTAGGNFTLPAYACPYPFVQTFIVGTGGNPGLAAGTNNTALAMMSALGPCSGVSSLANLKVNEQTTIGALATFYPWITSSSNFAYLASSYNDYNSFNEATYNLQQYVNIVTGAVPGPNLQPAYYFASSTTISTLADILSTCINSPGGVAGDGSACGNLFTLVTPPGGVAPTDTIGAVLDLLKNPTLNTSAIYKLTPSTGAPFLPTLSGVPPDWTIPLLPVPGPPNILTQSGNYIGPQIVWIFPSLDGDTIYYTLDGSTPTTSSNVYTKNLTATSTETIKAFETTGGRVFSGITTVSLTISGFPATVLVTGGGQTAKVNTVFANPIKITVLDSSGKPVIGANGLLGFNGTGAGANASYTPSNCATDTTGSCTFTVTANGTAGTYQLFASAGATDTYFTLTNSLTAPVIPPAPITAPQSYVVTVTTDTTTGVSTNCVNQAVTSSGSNASCSLRDALAAAASTATSTYPATITFASATAKTIMLANGTLNIPSYTTIQGATTGSGTTLTNLITVDGNNASSVFTVASGVVQAAIDNVTIQHGNANGSAYASLGGAIYSSGALNVSQSTFSGNSATSSGGAISNNGGTLSVAGSTFAGNSATNGYGGAIDNFGGGTATVTNSTFTANQAPDGGAIYSSGTITVGDSTIAGNTATYGGGLYNLGMMAVTNSLITGNSYQDCGGLYCSTVWKYVTFGMVGSSVVDQATIGITVTDNLGNSFFQTYTYGQFSTPASLASAFGAYFSENYSGADTASIGAEGFGGLLVISPTPGTTVNSIAISNPGQSFTAMQTTIPFLLSSGNNVYSLTPAQANLSALGNYGGPTQTMVPLSGSVALCAISPSTATGTDQRGQPRVVTVGATTCQDAGAVQTSN